MEVDFRTNNLFICQSLTMECLVWHSIMALNKFRIFYPNFCFLCPWHRWIFCQENRFFPRSAKKLWKTFPIFSTFRSGKFFKNLYYLGKKFPPTLVLSIPPFFYLAEYSPMHLCRFMFYRTQINVVCSSCFYWKLRN